MTSPATLSDFLEQILQSGLLPEATLEKADIPVDADPVEAARALVKLRLLTPFQARAFITGQTRSFFLTQRYKLLEHLGRGGMGDVYLAEHLLLRRVVALKIILVSNDPDDSLATPGAIERFFREARAVAALDHPNVVRVFDMDRTNLGPCLVMEYVDGTNIHSIIRKSGPLPVERAVDAVRQAAAGLEHAHLSGLIHRDVKPGNLLLDRMGTVKVVDLGLARHRDATMNAGLTGMYDDNKVIGTADFQPPEQGLDSGSADARSDVYGLGAAFYFMLTGQVPFPGGTITNKLLAHQIKPAPNPAEINPEVPQELADVVMQMMAKRPVDRPQSMAEVWHALTPWAVDALPTPAASEMPKHPPSAYRLGLCPPPTDSMPQVTKLFVDDRPNGGGNSHLSGARPGLGDTPKSMRTAQLGSRPTKAKAPRPSGNSDGELAPVELAETSKTSAETMTAALTKPLSRRTLLLGVGGGFIASAIAGGVYWQLTKPSVIPTPKPPVPFPTNQDTTIPTTPPTKPAAPTGVVLAGSGSSFVKRAMDRWAEKYSSMKGVRIEYQSIGSGDGVNNMINDVSRFGCTEAYLTDDQLKKAGAKLGAVVHVPLTLGAVVPTYNLPGLVSKKPLNFTGQLLAKIYLGEIVRWNDDAIASCNPDAKLPDLPIKLVVREDKSGTTAVFTDYLCKASPLAFAKKVGQGVQPLWPEKLAATAEKNDGIAKYVNETEGALGYVELIYAKEKTLRAGSVQNQAGRYVEPDLKSVTAAAASLRSFPDDLRFTLTDAPGEASYPIVGCAWAVLYVRQNDPMKPGGKELVEFLRWITHEGQDVLLNMHYAPLPSQLIPLIDKKLASIITKPE